MKEIQEEKLLDGRKAYVSPFITVHEVDYESLMGQVTSIVGSAGRAYNSAGGGTNTFDIGGTSAGEAEDDEEIDHAKSWGDIWEEE